MEDESLREAERLDEVLLLPLQPPQDLVARVSLDRALLDLADQVSNGRQAGSQVRERLVGRADIEGVRGVNGGALANSQMVEGITVLLVSINRAYKISI